MNRQQPNPTRTEREGAGHQSNRYSTQEQDELIRREEEMMRELYSKYGVEVDDEDNDLMQYGEEIAEDDPIN